MQKILKIDFVISLKTYFNESHLIKTFFLESKKQKKKFDVKEICLSTGRNSF